MLTMTPAESAAADPARTMRLAGLTEAEIGVELKLLRNALDFYNKTSDVGGNHIDMGCVRIHPSVRPCMRVRVAAALPDWRRHCSAESPILHSTCFC